MIRSIKGLGTQYMNVELTVVISLARCQNAFVVVSEFDKVDAIALAEVGVDFFSTLQVKEAH